MRNEHLAVFVMFLLFGCGPWGETPGLRLGGTPTPIPSDGFAFLQNGHEEILFEAWGSIFPRVVTIWGVGTDDNVYVWGNPESGWGSRASERPDVRVRIGDSSYELRAEGVTDPEEFVRVVALYKAKYAEPLKELFGGKEPAVEDFGHFWRLSPRG